MSASSHITPELEELLLDVAADRDALLLRIPPKQALRAAFDDRIDVSPDATGLTPAERQLVRVHRAELSYVLRVACVDRLHRNEIGAQRMIRDVRPDARIPEDIGDRGRALARNAFARGLARRADCDDDAAWTEELLSTIQDDRSVDVGQLAAMSLRLVPTRQARCYQGLDLAFAGKHESALRVFLELAELDGDRENQAIAWTNVAMVLGELGRTEHELTAARNACRWDRRILMAQADKLVTSLELGDQPSAQEAASELDELLEPEHSAIHELVRHARGIKSRCPDLAVKAWAFGARLRSTGVAARIVHELK